MVLHALSSSDYANGETLLGGGALVSIGNTSIDLLEDKVLTILSLCQL